MRAGRMGLAALLLWALAAPLPAQRGGGLVFTPPEWDFGTTADNRPVELELVVRNESRDTVEVLLVPGCRCLYARPQQAQLAPGSEQRFELGFDPEGLLGPIDEGFRVRSSLMGLQESLFAVRGEVRLAVGPGAEQPAAGSGIVLQLAYHYSPGCRSCERFLAEELPALEAELGVRIEVQRNSIYDPEAHRRYLRQLRRLGQQERAYPSIVAGDRVLQGYGEIEHGLREAVLELAAGGGDAAAGGREAAPAGPAGRSVDLAVLPVVLAGLLDGVNPCAFTTLIFLVSALAVAGRSRRQVLVIGLFYTASVFVTYFLVGLGFFSAVRFAQSFAPAAALIRWALVAVLAAFAALSFHDYLAIRRGRTDKVLLQLPGALKRQIHGSIRSRARSTALLGSALVLGFLVSVFELACTGQVYLPTIVYMVRSGRQLRGYAYLLLYNLGFIVPLAAVFALSFAGLSLKGLTTLFQKSMAGVKLALAGLFVGLAALTILL